MQTLYYASNTCALASHIALEESGNDYEAVRISFQDKQQQSQDYLTINPKGRVPALVTDAGILTETPAILAYIAQSSPGSEVAIPADAFAFAQIQSFNSYLCSTVHVNHAHRMRGYRWTDDPAAMESMKAKVPETIGDSFQLIEDELLEGPWVMGNRYSICDPYLFTLSQWLEGDGVDIARFPKVQAHSARMQSRPAVASVLADEAS